MEAIRVEAVETFGTHFLKVTLEWVAQRNGIVKKLIYPKNTLTEWASI